MATNAFLARDLNLGSAKAALSRFLAWEREQCRSLLPASAAAWLVGPGAREASVRAGASELILPGGEAGQDMRISGAEIAANSLDAALGRRKLSRRSLAIVLELPAQAFLIRRMEVPLAALTRLPQMIQAEIERRTPFRRDEVLIGWRVAPHEAKGKTRVCVALLRRDLIAPALHDAGLVVDDLALIRADAEVPFEDFSWTPAVAIRAGDAAAKSAFAHLAWAMTAFAALLFLVGLGAIFWRQGAEAQALDAQIEDMSARAAHVRQVADRATKKSRLLADLHEKRLKNPLLIDLWEEVSRLTPDGAYLTDYHLSESRAGERAVDLTGLAQSAVGLPLLFANSRYFSEAALTAPITADPTEKKERFSLRLKARAAPLAAAPDSQRPAP